MASPLVLEIGAGAYRYRQYLSLALLAVSVFMARPLTGNLQLDAALHAVSFGLVIGGGGLRSWAMGHHSWRRVRKSHGARRTLITAGPYAMVRNPLYLGTLLISAGIALMSGSWVIIVLYAALFWSGYAAIILWEESRLDAQFGERYHEYFQTVPRLVPTGRVWRQPEGAFSTAAMMRCMEPIKTVGFLAVLALMLHLKSQ